MPVEGANYISQLNPASPTDASLKSEGDNEFRQIKTVLQTQFPNLATTPVTVTSNQLNDVTNKALRAGDTYAGTHNFTGAVLNVASQATAATGTAATNLDVVDAKILAASIAATLPSQTGNSGKYVTTNGTTASWANIPVAGMTLIATLTPTAAANVDFLTTFSSTYDNYLVMIDGVKPSVNDNLCLRYANAGTPDSGSVYFSSSDTSFSAVAAQSHLVVGLSTLAAGSGMGAVVHIKNVNDAVMAKTGCSSAMGQADATPFYFTLTHNQAYSAANTVSGFRLYWVGGANFAATGKVRVYGYSNT